MRLLNLRAVASCSEQMDGCVWFRKGLFGLTWGRGGVTVSQLCTGLYWRGIAHRGRQDLEVGGGGQETDPTTSFTSPLSSNLQCARSLWLALRSRLFVR